MEHASNQDPLWRNGQIPSSNSSESPEDQAKKANDKSASRKRKNH